MKAPTYEQQVNPQGLPQVRQSGQGASLDAFGGRVATTAQEVQGAAKGVYDFLDKRAEIQAADEITKAENDLQTRLNLWQADTAKNRRGDKAVGLTQEADEWFKQQVQEVSGALTNPRAQSAFQKLAARTQPGLLGFARRHEDEQSLVSLEANTKANTLTAIDAALTDPTDDNIIKSTDQIRRNAATLNGAMGLGPDATNQMIQKDLTTMHARIAQGLLDANNPDAAAAHLEKYKEVLDPAQLEEMRAKVAEGGLIKKGQVGADEIRAKGLPEEKAIKLATEKYEGKEREYVLKELKGQYADERRIDREKKESVASDAWQYLMDNKALPPLSMRQRMDGKDRAALEARYEDDRLGRKRETNLVLYGQLLANPDAVREMPASKFYALANEIKPEDFKHLIDIRTGKSSNPNDPSSVDFGGVNSVLNQRLQGIGLDPTPKEADNNAPRVAAIRQHIQNVVLDKQRMLGRKLTDKEMVDAIDGEMLRNRQFRVTHLIGAPSTQSQRLFSLNVSDLPKDTVESIKAGFKEQGIENPTDADILGEYYNADYMQRRNQTKAKK